MQRVSQRQLGPTIPNLALEGVALLRSLREKLVLPPAIPPPGQASPCSRTPAMPPMAPYQVPPCSCNPTPDYALLLHAHLHRGRF